MPVCRISEIFSMKEWRDHKTGGRGRSRLLKMAPFDRSYTTFYWSATVSIAVCCIIFKLFDVVSSEGHSKWYHSKGWVRFPIRFP